MYHAFVCGLGCRQIFLSWLCGQGAISYSWDVGPAEVVHVWVGFIGLREALRKVRRPRQSRPQSGRPGRVHEREEPAGSCFLFSSRRRGLTCSWRGGHCVYGVIWGRALDLWVFTCCGWLNMSFWGVEGSVVFCFRWQIRKPKALQF